MRCPTPPLRWVTAAAVGLLAVTPTLAPASAAPPAPHGVSGPAPCERLQPPQTTTTKAEDNARAGEANKARVAAIKAAHPDRPLSIYSTSNEIGEGWRYRWDGGEMRYVSFLNRYGAMLLGTAFAPDPVRCPGPRPVVLVAEGITANEVLYWWVAQSLAEAGYVVMTFDFQNQGLSEANGHDPVTGVPVPQVCGSGVCARGADPATGFLQDAQDALHLLLSRPGAPYGHTAPVLPTDAPFDPHFPFADQVDPSRVGLIGHSEGARIVSVLQGQDGRVDAVVGLDNLATTLKGDAGSSSSQCRPVGGGIGVDMTPAQPRVPAMGQAAPNNVICMDRDLKKVAYEAWRAEGLPAQEVVLARTVHGADYAPTPTTPVSNPYGSELSSWYSLAWFDRWLLGDLTAEQRLFAKSFQLFDHYLGPISVTKDEALDTTFASSADTGLNSCEDLRAGCDVVLPAEPNTPGRSDHPGRGGGRGNGLLFEQG